jgi:hypothetical protein
MLGAAPGQTAAHTSAAVFSATFGVMQKLYLPNSPASNRFQNSSGGHIA